MYFRLQNATAGVVGHGHNAQVFGACAERVPEPSIEYIRFVTCTEVVARDISYPERNDVAECGDVLFFQSGLTNLSRALTIQHLLCLFPALALCAAVQSHGVRSSMHRDTLLRRLVDGKDSAQTIARETISHPTQQRCTKRGMLCKEVCAHTRHGYESSVGRSIEESALACRRRRAPGS